MKIPIKDHQSIPATKRKTSKSHALAIIILLIPLENQTKLTWPTRKPRFNFRKTSKNAS